MRPNPAPRGRSGLDGFTLIEMLVVLLLAVLLVIVLQQTLIVQRQFHESRNAVSVRLGTVGTGLALLGANFRGASVSRGDVAVLAPRRVRIRIPVGSGTICGSDNAGNRIGVVDVVGSWLARSGDSVTVQSADGPFDDLLDRVEGPGRRVPCTESRGGLIIRLDSRVRDLEFPSTTRVFRTVEFESVVENGFQYLYRVEGTRRDLLLGPLDTADGFEAWYSDEDGVPVGPPPAATRITMQVLAVAPPRRGVTSSVRDTIRLTFGGRNR